MGKLRYSGRLFRELVQFARENKAYWLVPLALVTMLAALLVTTAQAGTPFIYILF